jgi:hypothetical protein
MFPYEKSNITLQQKVEEVVGVNKQSYKSIYSIINNTDDIKKDNLCADTKDNTTINCVECIKSDPPVLNPSLFNKKRLLCRYHYRQFHSSNTCKYENCKRIIKDDGSQTCRLHNNIIKRINGKRVCSNSKCETLCNNRYFYCDKCYMRNHRKQKKRKRDEEGIKDLIETTIKKRLEKHEYDINSPLINGGGGGNGGDDSSGSGSNNSNKEFYIYCWKSKKNKNVYKKIVFL